MATPKRSPRPKKKPAPRGRSPTLTIPASDELLDTIDRYAEDLTRRRLGVHVSRAQAVREILIDALARWQVEKKIEP